MIQLIITEIDYNDKIINHEIIGWLLLPAFTLINQKFNIYYGTPQLLIYNDDNKYNELRDQTITYEIIEFEFLKSLENIIPAYCMMTYNDKISNL